MIKQCGSGLDHYGEIHTGMDLFPVSPKMLAQPTLYAVTADGVANLSAYTDAQAHPDKTGAGDDR